MTYFPPHISDASKARTASRAFTIVELLIVIVVIAILAAITIVAYNGVAKRTVSSTIQSSLQSIGQKMEVQKIDEGAYPADTFPAGIEASEGVGYAFTVVADTANEFCINGTSSRYSDVAWHIDQDKQVAEGLCEGDVITSTIIGDYNEAGDTGLVYNFARTAHGNGTLGLTLSVGQEWDSVHISWDEQPDAVRYELKARNPSSSSTSTKTFYYRTIANGGGSCSTGTSDSSMGTGCGASYTGMIPAGTTSLDWSDTTNGIPISPGQVFEYEIRYVRSDNSYSAWDVASLANYVDSNTEIPTVENFTATPNAAFTSNTLAWDQVDDFAPFMNQVYYELKARNPSSSSTSTKTFYYRTIANGGGSCSTGTSDSSVGTGCGTDYSGMIPHDMTSMVWTDATTGVPMTMGQNFEYQIRVRITGQVSYWSAWSDTQTVSYPIQSNSDIPAVDNFTVTPNSAYTNNTLSWSQVANFAPHMSQVYYELQARNPSSNSTSAKTFYYRAIADGSGGCSTGTSDSSTGAGCGTSMSGVIPYTTTSMTWTDATTGVPKSAGQTFEYRMRVRVTGEKSYYGPWTSTKTIAYPIQANSDIPTISNFTVTPNAGFTNVTLNWNQVSNFAPHMGEVYYEVKSRNPSSNSTSAKTFYYRAIADGSGGCSTGTSDSSTGAGCGTSLSGMIPYTTTSMTWTDTTTGVPSVSGQTFEYEARVRISGEKTYYSPWVVRSVTH